MRATPAQMADIENRITAAKGQKAKDDAYQQWSKEIIERNAQYICAADDCTEWCSDPTAVDREPHIQHFCALHEIASYNTDDLREWGEENAAAMVELARQQLRHR